MLGEVVQKKLKTNTEISLFINTCIIEGSGSNKCKVKLRGPKLQEERTELSRVGCHGHVIAHFTH